MSDPSIPRSVHFTEEHDAFRGEVRRFVTTEVTPHATEWEAARRIPREIFARMGELGLLGICFDERYGGSGADLFQAVVFLEELPRSLMGGFCAAVSVQQFMATQHIYRAGSEYLKQRYVVPSIAGRTVGALAITEPDAGSDVAAVRTRAVRDGDVFVVHGAKTFITNGAEGDFYTTAVRTGPDPGAAGISLVVIDAGAPGVRVSRLEKLGWHASDTAELSFTDVRVPAAHVVGSENSGFYQIMESFALERLAAAAIAVGSAAVAIEESLAYMAQREAFGKPLHRFQALRHRVADLAAQLEAARRLTYHASWLMEQGEPAIRESSMAKLVATELGTRVADACVQIHGGYGFMEEYPAARFFRDARGATITAGTSEIMREIIARGMFEQAGHSTVSSTPAADPPRREPAAERAPAPAPVHEHERSPSRDEARATIDAEPTSPSDLGARDPDSLEGFVRSLPDRVRAEQIAGWDATFHLVVRDADQPEWTIRVHDGACTVDEGLSGKPTCVVRTREKTYIGISNGTVKPQTAFLTGKIKVSNVVEMMRFVKAFRAVR